MIRLNISLTVSSDRGCAVMDSNTNLKRQTALMIGISLLAVSLLSVVSNIGVVNAQKEFLIYENPAYGVEINYPSHWEVLEIPSGFDFVIAFVPQIEINSDIFVQGIDVVVEPIPEGFTLDEYTEYEIDFDLGFFSCSSCGHTQMDKVK